MKRLIKRILREHKSDKYYTFLDRVSTMIRMPYFKSMENFTIDDEEDQEYVLSKIYGNINIDYEFEYDEDGIMIYDDKGNEIYYEDSDGDWEKSDYDDKGNNIYFENSYIGFWTKSEYDDKGNMKSYEDSNGNWRKYEYDDKGNQIYYEDSDGDIEDDR